MQHKPVIGLVGGIGAGKSLVAGQLASLGCAVIDADALSREALRLDEVRDEVVRWWGPDVVGDHGHLDRSAIGKIVFNDATQLSRLERLIHPIVHRERETLHRLYEGDPQVCAIVEDCPLLIESGVDAGCDVIILVDASLETRLARVRSSRGWDASELERRAKNQASLDKKRERADYIVGNDADEPASLAQTRGVLSQILRDAK